jgi:hypothetical protein
VTASVVVLCVALAGAGLACLWFYVNWWLPVALVLLGCAAGWLLFRSGRCNVARDPEGALKRMEWRLLLPGSIAASAAALIILIQVWFQTQENWSDEGKQLVTAVSTAVTTTIGALFVKGAETFDNTWLAGPIKKAFQDALAEMFDSGTEGDLALYNIQGDWGREDRWERAKIIAEELLKLAERR